MAAPEHLPIFLRLLCHSNPAFLNSGGGNNQSILFSPPLLVFLSVLLLALCLPISVFSLSLVLLLSLQLSLSVSLPLLTHPG